MRVCLVTDRVRLARRLGIAPEAALEAIVALAGEAARAGVDLIQVREPGLEARALLQLVRSVIAEARPAGARIVVNDRLDVALAAGADGVHLKASSMPARAVRRLAPPPFLVGQSAHALSEVRAAVEGGVDYIIFGTVFPSASKGPGWRLAGVTGLGEAVRAAAPVPVLAIGGVSPDTAPQAAAAGAAGAAVIDALLPDRIPAGFRLVERVGALRRVFDTSSGVS